MIAWAAFCHLLGVTAQAQKVSDPINDCAFFVTLGEQGGRLVEDGKDAAAETLRGQLVRTHCDLKLLPTPATKPMTAAEMSGIPILDDCGNVVGLAATTQTVVDERNNMSTLKTVFKHGIPAAGHDKVPITGYFIYADITEWMQWQLRK